MPRCMIRAVNTGKYAYYPRGDRFAYLTTCATDGLCTLSVRYIRSVTYDIFMYPLERNQSPLYSGWDV